MHCCCCCYQASGRVAQACRAFIYRTAQQADEGKADRKDCAAVILYAAEAATRMALDAIQVWRRPGLWPAPEWGCDQGAYCICRERAC